MSDLRELYQDMILDHHKRPRNRRKLEDATCSVEGYNPLCGDRVTVYLKIDGDVVKDVSFEGSGCAISTASASLMTESVKGKTVAQADAIFNDFRKLITGDDDPSEALERLGKLGVLSGVREFPTRVKCATLVWHTLHSALSGDGDPVTTE